MTQERLIHIQISACSQCPFARKGGFDAFGWLYCGKALAAEPSRAAYEFEIENENAIPDWCPLPLAAKA